MNSGWNVPILSGPAHLSYVEKIEAGFLPAPSLFPPGTHHSHSHLLFDQPLGCLLITHHRKCSEVGINL